MPSLGDLARKLRAERAKTPEKAKLFTNDNLPARPPEEKETVATSMSPTPSGPKKAETNKKTKAEAKPQTESAAETESPEGVYDESYFRTQMSTLQDQLNLHQRELQVLQQKLGQGSMQYYADPNKTLQQEYSRSDVAKLNQQIANKQQQIADDEKAMDDLRDQLRREGGDPGWLR